MRLLPALAHKVQDVFNAHLMLREALQPHAHVLQEEARRRGEGDGVVGVEIGDVREVDRRTVG